MLPITAAHCHMIPMSCPEITNLFLSSLCCECNDMNSDSIVYHCGYAKTLLLYFDGSYSLVHATFVIPAGFSTLPPTKGSLEMLPRKEMHGDPLVPSDRKDLASMSMNKRDSIPFETSQMLEREAKAEWQAKLDEALRKTEETDPYPPTKSIYFDVPTSPASPRKMSTPADKQIDDDWVMVGEENDWDEDEWVDLDARKVRREYYREREDFLHLQ